MRLKIITVVVAIAALSFAAVGSAAAQPVRHGPAQINGTQLANALLSPSAFWNGVMGTGLIDSGSKLQSTRVKDHVPAMTCTVFEDGDIFISDFGDTAAAGQSYANPDWISTYPDTVISGYEEVFQFATTAAATTLYNQAYAKYAACQSFFEGKVHVQALSVTKTTISRDRAFVVHVQDEESGFTYKLYGNTLYVQAGTNVYLIFNRSGNNDEPSPALMSKLIQRVQALYPHGK